MKVSVIVPVYNAEIYLGKCLDSILEQTYHNFELILVNDGSEDKSGRICDEYAWNRENIRVIHKDNEGLICARIEGIKNAEGEYIAFVDADDWIEKDFLEMLVKNMEENNADIVVSGCIKECGGKGIRMANNIPAGIYDRQDLSMNMSKDIYSQMLHIGGFYEFGILPYMWNKLYKRKLLLKCYENIDVSIYDGEDVAAVFPYLLKAEKTVVTDYAGYHYLIHEKSMTAKKKQDYYENVSRLYLYLNTEFKKTDYYEIMLPQLNQYMRMMVWQGKPERFIEAEKYIFPFKEIPQGARIILYGAGRVGRTFYHQLMLSQYCSIAIWVDKGYQKDELRRLGIVGLDALEDCSFDYIVIAVEKDQLRVEIYNELLEIGIAKEKII